MDTPILIDDGGGTVHAFNWQPVEGKVAVIYSRWTLAGGWTEPVDILLAPAGGEARVSGVFLDDTGTFHLIFYGGNDLGFGLYYSKAHALLADKATSWSQPIPVAEGAGPLSYAALTGDGKGNLWVVYSGRKEGLGLYAVQSADWGESWSKPVIVFLTRSVRHPVAFVDAIVDSRGELQVVWTVVNQSGRGDSVNYARLAPDSPTWTRPYMLAEVDEYSAERAVITEHGGELFAVYLNSSPPKRWMRRSSDGGRTWSSPVHIVEGWIGGNGPACMVHDSNGALHLFFGNRITGAHGEVDTHGLWHSAWDGRTWSRPEAVVSGPQVLADEGTQFDPWEPHAVANLGNVLLVTWKTDPGAGGNGIWYSYTKLNAPDVPAVPLPPPPPSATVTAAPTRESLAPAALPRPILTQTPRATTTAAAMTQTNSTSFPLNLLDTTEGRWAAVILPVSLLVVVVAGGRLIRFRR